MRLQIKMVQRCENDHRGEFIVKSSNQCEIQISKNRNQTIDDFAETLLHELLHLWVTILQTHGLKDSIRREHGFINSIVPKVIKELNKHFK